MVNESENTNYHIKNISFVDVVEKKIYRTDIFITNGAISKKKDSRKKYTTIEGENLHLLPCFFDLHSHCRGLEEKHKNTLEEFQKSALKGGYAFALLMPNTKPPIDNITTLNQLKSEAKNLDIYLYYCATLTKNREGKELSPFFLLKKEGVVAFSDDGSCIQSTQLMYSAAKIISALGALIIDHPEVEELTKEKYFTESLVSCLYSVESSPSFCEDIMVYRDLCIAKETDVKMHLTHLSTAESIRIIYDFNRFYEKSVTFDVTPHHLLLSVEDITKFDGTYMVKPFLRRRQDMEVLQKALIENKIAIIATDHAPHSIEEKNRIYYKSPFGFVGLEIAFPLLFTHFVKTGNISPVDLIAKFTINPMKILDIDFKKYFYNNATFSIWDLNKVVTITPEYLSSKAKNTPFLNYKTFGEVKYVFIKGRVVYNNE
jgi:dihydroorotase